MWNLKKHSKKHQLQLLSFQIPVNKKYDQYIQGIRTMLTVNLTVQCDLPIFPRLKASRDPTGTDTITVMKSIDRHPNLERCPVSRPHSLQPLSHSPN
jgi:hypothetical protein